MIPEDERSSLEDDLFSLPPVRSRRLGLRSAIAWVFLALIVLGGIATLLIWVSHRLGSVAG
jgi:hypothetical protein